MPEPLHPPFAQTAWQQPRTLSRWLDINAQGGPLGRTQTYITLPAFSVDVQWGGYSDIVAAFNFEGPNNFSLKGVSANVPSNPNYCLCIMWIDWNNQTHRYALWKGVGEVIYIPHPLYTGQLIGQNFRLEVWSTDSSPAVQTTAINFFTSVLGNQDYKWGRDSTLVSSDGLQTNFSIGAANIVNLPNDIGLLFQVDPYNGLVSGGGGVLTSWTSKILVQTGATGQGQPIYGYPVLIPFGSLTTVIASGVPAGGNCVSINNNSNYLYNNAPFTPWGVQAIILTCMMEGNEAANTYLFSAFPSGITLFWNNGTVTAGGTGPSVTGLSQGVWYTFLFWLIGGNATLSVYNTQTGALVATNTTLAPIVSYTNAIGLGNSAMKILEAIMCSNTLSTADVAQIVLYFQQKYFSTNVFNLPFVWPAGSYPKTNSRKTSIWMNFAEQSQISEPLTIP